MIRNTEKLIRDFKNNPRMDGTILASYCRITSLYGDRNDAAALFRLFAEEPSDYKRSLLLDPIMRCGDQELAEDIARVCFDGKKLKENMPGDILHVLGYLDHDRMMDYMVASITANDWYLSKAACIGLMHLPCERYAEIFADELERVYGQPLFPEFLPALCFKFTDARMVPRLMEWGEQASTDCNAGLILGIAAFGRSQQAKVRRILMEPKWEMDATGTGSHWWGYMSMQMSEVTFSQLISHMKDRMPLDLHKNETLEGEAFIVHSLQVLHDLMEVKLSDDLHPLRFAATNNERFSDLYAQLFQWSNEYEDDSMIGRIQHVLGYDHPMVNQYIVLRTRMEMAIRREMELEALRLQS
ncbi:hypothetical protein [Paenibacillus lautus]|uniref:hypothetical protein n=1 Tax=Paenibacillus lautus TaxID=1401 RepID=UPI001C7D4E11|nr:hypothetical protein [Paenibacillus lautus]MBX4148992.1 hypothetical protein [Paenibacillus lautus]